MKLDSIRITKTAERTVRGLYAKHFKRALPDTHEVSVSILDFQKDDHSTQTNRNSRSPHPTCQYGKRRSFGKTLDLQYLTTDDDPNSSIWWARLHGAFGFLGFTTPKL